MDKLRNIDAVLVSQSREPFEVFTGFEQKNKYKIFDQKGNDLYFAAEFGGSFIGRIFLKAMRPFKLKVVDEAGTDMLSINRPFKFMFHECEVYDANEKLLGRVKWNFHLVKRKYTVLGPLGEEKFSLLGPFFRPWTFRIIENGQETGMISKKWSGMLTEFFTDADNFGIKFPERWDSQTRALSLGAVFLIDFVHFENKD